MARIARRVAPGHPYQVTQRSNRRAQTFIEKNDYLLYREMVAEAARKADAEI